MNITKLNTHCVIGLLLPLCAASPAFAYVHASGGSGFGSASAGHYGNSSYAAASSTRTGENGGTLTRSGSATATTNPYGGTSYSGSQHATYTAPDGQSVSGSKSTSGTAYNGSTSAYHTTTASTSNGAYYGSSHTTYGTTNGTTAYHSNYYGTAVYPSYHPPTTVNYYGSSCYNCGGWSAAGAAAAGLAVGVVAGAAVASANTAAATSNAYNAGVVAGANSVYAVGAIYATLPAGSVTTNVQGQTYYLNGNTWFYPSYGANGVYYRVVPAP
jgi:hypothetical protein